MSGCCSVPKGKSAAKETCPGCGEKGRDVDASTVRAILKPGVVSAFSGAPFRICQNPTCDHLYFGNGLTAVKGDAAVRVGLKETSDPVPLCYCFGFTRADVRAEVQTTGKCTIPNRITAEVKAGRCECEVKNPSGSCCLGEVRKAVREAEKLFANREKGTGQNP